MYILAHTHTTDHNRYLNIYNKILFNLHWLKAFIVTECEICNFRLPRGLRRLRQRRRRRSTVRNRWRVLTFCWSIAVRCGRSRATVENDKIPTRNVKRRLAVVNTKTLLINSQLLLLFNSSVITYFREIYYVALLLRLNGIFLNWIDPSINFPHSQGKFIQYALLLLLKRIFFKFNVRSIDKYRSFPLYCTKRQTLGRAYSF